MNAFPYDHIIWDWNGTLFDDAALCVDIMNGMLIRRGLPGLSAERYARIFDFPVQDYYQLIGFDFATEPFERLSDEFMDAYHRRMRECGLRSGSREVLAAARARGLTQSILSAMKHDTLTTLITEYGLREYFTDLVRLDNHHAAGKGALGQQWIARQSLDPARMVLIGDTTHDYEVAQALGVACIQIPSGHHAAERLSASGSPLIHTLAELFPPEH